MMTITQGNFDVDVDAIEVYRSGARLAVKCRDCCRVIPLATRISLRQLVALVMAHQSNCEGPS
jgi:hypothetical protein